MWKSWRYTSNSSFRRHNCTTPHKDLILHRNYNFLFLKFKWNTIQSGVKGAACGISTSGWAVFTNIKWLTFAKSFGLHTDQELSAVVFFLLSGAIFLLHILPLAFNKHHPSHPRSACPRTTLLLSQTSSFFFPPLRFIWTGLSSSRSAAALHIYRTSRYYMKKIIIKKMPVCNRL